VIDEASMAHKAGQAGKSTRVMAGKRRFSAIMIGVFAMVLVIAVYLVMQNHEALGVSGIGLLVLLMLIRIIPDIAEGKINRKEKEERRAVRGAIAEEKVAGFLEGLGEDYCIFHDVESPYGNIDHVVLGKTSGLFLLETKSHGGKVTVIDGRLLVNGKYPEKDFIAQTLRNTYWLRDKVSEIAGVNVWVTPVIVFTNAFVSPTKPVKGVHIINRKYMNKLLESTDRSGSATKKLWEVREEVEKSLF
jgi:hypothetical protein